MKNLSFWFLSEAQVCITLWFLSAWYHGTVPHSIPLASISNLSFSYQFFLISNYRSRFCIFDSSSITSFHLGDGGLIGVVSLLGSKVFTSILLFPNIAICSPTVLLDQSTGSCVMFLEYSADSSGLNLMTAPCCKLVLTSSVLLQEIWIATDSCSELLLFF